MTDVVSAGITPVVRYEGNPIITPEDISPDVNAVMNPGATTFDGARFCSCGSRIERATRASWSRSVGTA